MTKVNENSAIRKQKRPSRDRMRRSEHPEIHRLPLGEYPGVVVPTEDDGDSSSDEICPPLVPPPVVASKTSRNMLIRGRDPIAPHFIYQLYASVEEEGYFHVRPQALRLYYDWRLAILDMYSWVMHKQKYHGDGWNEWCEDGFVISGRGERVIKKVYTPPEAVKTWKIKYMAWVEEQRLF